MRTCWRNFRHSATKINLLIPKIGAHHVPAIRRAVEKIPQRLALFELMVYHRKVKLPNFHLFTSPQGDGIEFLPNTHFTLHTTFQVPADWKMDNPLALYLLPLGNAGNFGHPEVLVYIDGESFAACDRHPSCKWLCSR